MRKFIKVVWPWGFFALVGCIPSLHPLYTENDLIFEPSLVGEWSGKDSKETWTFTKNGDKEYKLLCVDKGGKKGEFIVYVLRVEGRLFVDFFPAESDLKENDFYKMHFMPVHTFMRIQQIEPTLQLAYLKPDWIKKLLQEDPGAIRHEKVGDTFVLTAQPKELQALLIKCEKTAEAWGECDPLTRKKKS